MTREELRSPIDFQNAFLEARDRTIEVCQPLVYDDYMIQSADFVSPPKWHLGHSTWFFETFLLQPYCKNYQPAQPKYREIFNSYYRTLHHDGVSSNQNMIEKPARGSMARPSLEDILNYREDVEDAVLRMIAEPVSDEMLSLVQWGIEHEAQHQELLLMDIQHIFFSSPIQPNYQTALCPVRSVSEFDFGYISYGAGIADIGAESVGFAYDNERPRHEVLTRPFALANRLVTNEEYLEFVKSNGYDLPKLWLSDGWDAKCRGSWIAPLYWTKQNGDWQHFTLRGTRRLVYDEPVAHVSYYEADAYARWRGARLPTEFEWEVAAKTAPAEGNFLEDEQYHPIRVSAHSANLPEQMFGDLWEWTMSPYSPYPGYRPPTGALAEYNGKFMCNQMVLRGGSFATPESHIRSSYRNFYAPDMRWHFAGIRLAKDL